MTSLHAVASRASPSTTARRLAAVRLRFPRPRLTDIEQHVHDEWSRLGNLFPPNARIAIAVGSRGIANLDRIVRATVLTLQAQGARPFVFPAMGSHGGATAAGQQEVLASLGITQDSIGCPILASMDVVTLESSNPAEPLYYDRHAWESDGTILINRIKPHTDFHGPYESGLAKMAVIGLGKEPAALDIHRYGVPGLRHRMPDAARRVLATGRILAGLAILENPYEETAAIEAIPGCKILDREPDLLRQAHEWLPRLPLEHADVLIIDRMGKNISGSGIDTNVIGRLRIAGEPEPASPQIRAILVTDLTPESHGNATGTGLADVITRRLFQKIDFDVTYRNVSTSGFLERGKTPIVAPTDRDGLACALRLCGPIPAGRERILRIRDTLHLHIMEASEPVFRELLERPDTEPISPLQDIFDTTGTLRPLAPHPDPSPPSARSASIP